MTSIEIDVDLGSARVRIVLDCQHGNGHRKIADHALDDAVARVRAALHGDPPS